MSGGQMAQTTRSQWRFFPWYLTAAFVAVIGINGLMVWFAEHTFPGVAAHDVFDRSNAYDRVLAEAAREKALGWTVATEVENGRLVVTLKDRAGAPLEGIRVTASLERPLGDTPALPMAFRAASPGRYVAEAAFSRPGQWEVLLTAASGRQTLHAARRIVVP